MRENERGIEKEGEIRRKERESGYEGGREG